MSFRHYSIRLIPLFVLGICLCATWYSWRYIDQSTSEAAAIAFNAATTDTLERIAQRLKDDELVLLGGAALFHAKNEVQRDDWREYVTSLKLSENRPGIQGVGFARWMSPAEAVKNVSEIRAEGFPNYSIRPPGERDVYTSIIFLEPFDWRNQRAFGYDMYTEPVRRAAMDRALETGTAALSGKVILVQETEKDVLNGVLMYVPVYKPGMALGTPEERRSAIAGFSYSPIRLADFISGAIGSQQRNFTFEIHDGESTDEAGLLFASAPAANSAWKDGRLSRTALIQLFGSSWTLLFKELPATEDAWIADPARMALPVGILFSLLVTLLCSVLLRVRETALELAGQMTLELKKSEGLLRAITDNSPEPIFVKDRDYRIIMANPATPKMSSESLEGVLGKNALDLFPDKNLAAVVTAHDEEVMTSGRSAVFEEDIPVGDTTRTFLAAKCPYRDPEGNIIGVIGIAHDITDRKKAEEEVRHQASLINSLLDSIPDIIFFKDKNGIYLGCNPPFAELVGRRREDIIGKTDYDLFDRGIADFFRENDKRMLSGMEPRRNEEWITYPDGHRILIDTLKTPYLGPDGELLGILGISRDITDRKRVEEKLQNERQRLSNIIQGTGAGTWEWNIPSGKVVFNERWAEMLGYTLAELAPVSIQTWRMLAHPDDIKEVEKLLERHFSGELPYYDGCCRMKHKNGSWIWIQDRGKVIKWTEDGKPLTMFGTHSDITDLKRAQQDLEIANRAALESVRAKSEFLANMSHEIRTPINGILGMSQLLEDTGLNDDQLDLLGSLKSSGDLLLGIINDILDLSKIEAGKIELHPVHFDLRKSLESLSKMLAAKLAEKNIQWVLKMDPAMPACWAGDSLRLQQVLMNLASNAIKFTPQGGGIVLQAETTAVDEGGTRLAFAVSDTGIGIPRDKQNQIFQAFTQADISTTRQFGGTGLGLTISEKLVRLMGGELKVKSQPGVGSVFYFDCLLQPSSEQPAEDVTAPGRLESSPAAVRPMRILVAEDNLVNQKLITRLLEKAGHTPVMAGDGQQALNLYSKESFDLIFMDIQMPVKDGVAATAEIRAIERGTGCRKTPIIALTAHALEGDRDKYLNLGMDGYLSKPIDRAELQRMIAAFG